MSFTPGLYIPASGGSDVYSFTMTAGEDATVVQGYSDGTIVDAIGSISAQPIAGNDLRVLITPVLPGISFHGDCLSDVFGKKLWVDGVEYPFDFEGWSYNSIDDVTEAYWDEGYPIFVDNNQYFVEIK